MSGPVVLLMASGAGPTAVDLDRLREAGADDVLSATIYPKPVVVDDISVGVRLRRLRRRGRRAARRQVRRAKRVVRRVQARVLSAPAPTVAPVAVAVAEASTTVLSAPARRRLDAAIEQVQAQLALRSDTSVVVALDSPSATVAWHLASQRPGLLAVSGIEAAIRIVGGEGTSAVDLSARGALLESPESLYPSLPEYQSRRRRTVVTGRDLEVGQIRALGDRRPDTDIVAITAGDESAVALLAGCSAVLVTTTADAVDGEARRGALAVLSPDEVLVGADIAAAPGAAGPATSDPVVSDSGRSSGAPHLLIGPANYAGQGAAWARAVDGRDGITARNLAVVNPASPFIFPADVSLTSVDWADPIIRARAAVEAVLPATHVIVEAMRPLLGLGSRDVANAWDVQAGGREVLRLMSSGRRVGLVLHGSEARRPGEHAQRYTTSPFGREEHAKETAVRTKATDAVHALLAELDAPRFVTTPDMLDFVPRATWLPIVVGPTAFRPGRELFSEARPVVVHAPSSGPLKGSEYVDPVLEGLHEQGLIEYRRLHHIPPSLVSAYLRNADIVVDQVVLGNPGVLATQALACGRVVVSHLPDQVRARYGSHVPVAEATPESLGEVIRALVFDRDVAREFAAQGPDFARTHHDGRRSAEVLARFVQGA